MEFIYFIIALLIAVSVHEFAHALCADQLGDPTPRVAGRLTLNPFKHLDFLGTIMLFLVHFGWGKPVPINPRYFKRPLQYSALTALSGPAANFLIAIMIAVFLKHTWIFLPDFIYVILMTIFEINLVLGAFNLLPLPPLDGSKILGLFVPRKYSNLYLKYLSVGPVYFVIFAAADYFLFSRWFGFSIFGYITGIIYNYLHALLFLGA